jgi:hypothetical protein
MDKHAAQQYRRSRSGSARAAYLYLLPSAAFGANGVVNVHRLSHILDYLLAHIFHPDVEHVANLIATAFDR